MTNKVSIATKPLVYGAFRHINNKTWNALAEYVDNSIQSFIDHKELLSKLNRNGKLEVRIDITNDEITIIDNAFGISEEYYQKAFELANIPIDNEGLNEFGMGMKVSSVWLSDEWTVETSAYGEPVKRTMKFDLKEVLEKEETSLPVQEEPYEKDAHYTIITLKKLSFNRPKNQQIQYIKKHLASIYTQYIRDGLLDLVVNGELQNVIELKCLRAPYYKKPDGESIEWKKDISFSFPGPNGKNYSVNGFIGLLETMSTSVDNGFLLFRRGRCIGTSYDNRYRPEELSGQVGSPRYKRIFGELNIEGFGVSFTKNSFQEDADFASFVNGLKRDLSNDSKFDIFGQAQNYTKPITSSEKKKIHKDVVKDISSQLAKPIICTGIDTSDISVSSNSVNEETPSEVQTKKDEDNVLVLTNPTESDNETKAKPIKTQIEIDGGLIIKLTIISEEDSSSNWLYKFTEIKKDEEYSAVINLNNKFFRLYEETIHKSGTEAVTYFIQSMVTTEIYLLQHGSFAGTEFRNMFNKIFGKI